MKRTIYGLVACAFSVVALQALDLTSFEPIGSVSSSRQTGNGVIIECRDRSETAISILASDLVRVRTSFRAALPERDHSWAIEKTNWDTPRWRLAEESDALVIATSELEVVIHRSPFTIEFRDAKTHRTINADARPMMFDPRTSAIASTKKLGFDEHFYGLGEKAAHLDKRRGEFVMWNTDAFGYQPGSDPLYQSIPFYIGWRNGDAYGIFYDNSYRTHFDLGATQQEYAGFEADGGLMDYYFFWGPSMKKILGRYADLTGHMPLPPMWTLGHQQSRYSYYPDSMVEKVVERYRAEDLPLDVIYLDIDYMNGYRVFTWNPERFPHPKALTDKLRAQGVKLVTIVDPGIKYQPRAPGASDPTDRPELAPQDRSYYVFDQGQARDYYLKRKDGRLYVPKVWPGDAVLVDYTIDAAARWWGDLFSAYTDEGVAGIWTDMNEPSDFNDQTGRSQLDVVEYDGGAYTTFSQDRNEFALNMARATYAGLERLRPNERPFVITRAAYAGIQRYSTTWTGDNSANWPSLAISLPMFESLGLSGEPFVGADIGGFTGNTTAELLTRWYEVGFLTPLFRNHGDLASYDHEPWRFGKYYEDIIRGYIKLRYRLLPFLYSTLEEAHRTGVPWFRPLLLNYQDDANVLNIDDEFMIGDDLLAAPILEPGATKRLVYLPNGTWFDYWTGQQRKGGQTIHVDAPLETLPLFVRGGAILALGPEMNWIGQKPFAPITFEIYPDERGQAATMTYEDDGISPAYKQGVYRRLAIHVTKSGNGYAVDIGAEQGTYRPPARNLEFHVAASGANHRVFRLADDGAAHRIAIQ